MDFVLHPNGNSSPSNLSLLLLQCCESCPPNLISELPQNEVEGCAAAPEANQPLSCMKSQYESRSAAVDSKYVEKQPKPPLFPEASPGAGD